MRVLLDESLPRPLANQIAGHDARTVSQKKWTSLSNGALLKQAATAFDVLMARPNRITHAVEQLDFHPTTMASSSSCSQREL